MPSSSRDTGTIKFGGENVPETILRLVIAFFIDKTSNKKQIYIENTPNMVFIFFHAKTGSLPILQECPYNHNTKQYSRSALPLIGVHGNAEAFHGPQWRAGGGQLQFKVVQNSRE